MRGMRCTTAPSPPLRPRTRMWRCYCSRLGPACGLSIVSLTRPMHSSRRPLSIRLEVGTGAVAGQGRGPLLELVAPEQAAQLVADLREALAAGGHQARRIAAPRRSRAAAQRARM